MTNAAISLSPEASPGSLENGSQRASSGSMIGRDPAEIFGTAPRGIGFATEDTVNTGVELHVTAASPVQMSFASGSRVVVCLASIYQHSREIDLSNGSVEVVASGGTAVLTLDKANPQSIVTLGGTYTFKFLASHDGCATVAVALAE